MNYIYVLQKSYVNNNQNEYGSRLIVVSKSYEAIVNYAKNARDYILKHGDHWLNYYKPQELFAWNSYNHYAVGSSDRKDRIIFKIQSVPEIHE